MLNNNRCKTKSIGSLPSLRETVMMISHRQFIPTNPMTLIIPSLPLIIPLTMMSFLHQKDTPDRVLIQVRKGLGERFCVPRAPMHGSARSRGTDRRGPYHREPEPERRRAPTARPRSRSPGRWRYAPPQDHVPYNPERPIIAPEDIAAQIARLEGALATPTEAPTGGVSPFYETLEAEPVNPGVKITGLESYDGTSDPNDHLSYYENLMVCHRYNDITCCRLFVSTFKSYARTWFSCLPPRSIHSWNEFKAVFLAKFRINVPQAVHTISLENVKQTREETLRSYID